MIARRLQPRDKNKGGYVTRLSKKRISAQDRVFNNLRGIITIASAVSTEPAVYLICLEMQTL